MKSVKLTSLRKLEVVNVPEPQIINPTDVKIKMTVMGVCGSDIHYFTDGCIGTQIVEYPFAVGHEGAGVVVEVGKGVTTVKPGDRIAIEPAMSCGQCDQCLAGRPHTCRKIKFLGCPGQAEGLMSEYIVMPEPSCVKIPDTLTFDGATITEPLAIGVYAVKCSHMKSGDTIGILGMGPIGQSVMAPAKLNGASKVYCTEKIDERVVLAAKNGATWVGNPLKTDVVNDILAIEPLALDIVFECSGNAEALEQSLHLIKPGGKLVIVGIPPTNTITLDINLLRRNEITVINVRRQNHSVHEAIDLVNSKKVDCSNWITHRFKLEQSQEAFETVANYRDGVLKAMIDFE
jgi:L-iditol 2-dehydrogenase